MRVGTRPPVARPARECHPRVYDEMKAWAARARPVDVWLELDGLALYTWGADQQQQQLFQVVERL